MCAFLQHETIYPRMHSEQLKQARLRARCTHLTKCLTKRLTIWLAVDALLATLTLG